MKRQAPLPGGELEHAVLRELWSLGTASARDIHTRIGEPAGLAYTTIGKVLDRLHDKGLVARERAGKAFVYRARYSREVVERGRARATVERLLGPDPAPSIASLVDAVENVDPDLLAELERAVRARRRARRGS